MGILIKNGRVIDPANRRDEILDILVENGKISQVAKNIDSGARNIIDAKDRLVLPGLVDMHVHLREPGREDKETVSSGTLAAAKGGVTSVLAMPNTEPAIDTGENIDLLKRIIRETAKVNVFICAAITKGRMGKELTDIASLKKAGAVAISDDGASVDNAELMLAALRQAAREDILTICHCEDSSLSNSGCVNLGLTSTSLGLRGASKESEYKRIKRDVELAQEAGAPVHIAHVSCSESVDLIAKSKKEGLRVSSETAPHYFALTEEAVLNYDTNFKMNPPLRGREDVAAIKQGLKDGTIDVIASDHAPHTENEKEIEFERAEFGVIGLETILSASITGLIPTKVLNWSDLAIRLALNPAKILGLKKGTLSVGADADIIVVSADGKWAVDKKNLVSKSKNSSFLGKELTGVIEYTICSGKIVYKA